MRLTTASLHNTTLGFNPRICKRCDLLFRHMKLVRICFNPRICKRCDRRLLSIAVVRLSFNPRICKRCDLTLRKSLIEIPVSIHASVKDATGETRELRFIYQVSIHASVKDATNVVLCKLGVVKFQSTHL